MMRSSTAKLCFTGLAMLGPFAGGIAVVTIADPLGFAGLAIGVVVGLFGLFGFGAAEFDEGWNHSRAMAAGRPFEWEG